ncbi:MAG: hypothetical protein WCI23_11315 [Chlorobiaceae bacterium]
MHEKLTGLKNKEIVEKTPEELFDPEIASLFIDNVEHCVQEGKTIQYEELIPFHGKQLCWETTLNPVSILSQHQPRNTHPHERHSRLFSPPQRG